jgi:hypothetical protein
LLSEFRCKVNVVLLAFSPTPAVLSAALPLKVAGTVAALNVLPFAGVVTEAVIGTVQSFTVAVVVPAAEPQLLTVAITLYRPEAATVAFTMVGFCAVEVNPFGPVQL